MRFALSKIGKRQWLAYEQGKRWPYYRATILANTFEEALQQFRLFAASARQHSKHS